MLTRSVVTLTMAMLLAASVVYASGYGSSDAPGLWVGLSGISAGFDGLSVSASVPTKWATISGAMGRGLDGDDDFGDYWQISLMRAFSGGSTLSTNETGLCLGMYHDKYRTNGDDLWGVGLVTGPISPAAMRAASPVVRAFVVYMEGGETLIGASTEYSFSGCAGL
jgi:hypothetical protein